MIWKGKNNNGIVPMPDCIVTHNGYNEKCDMAYGPCSCGAWHSRKDWERRIADDIMGYTKAQKRVFQQIVDIVDEQERNEYKELVVESEPVRCLDI